MQCRKPSDHVSYGKKRIVRTQVPILQSDNGYRFLSRNKKELAFVCLLNTYSLYIYGIQSRIHVIYSALSCTIIYDLVIKVNNLH